MKIRACSILYQVLYVSWVCFMKDLSYSHCEVNLLSWPQLHLMWTSCPFFLTVLAFKFLWRSVRRNFLARAFPSKQLGHWQLSLSQRNGAKPTAPSSKSSFIPSFWTENECRVESEFYSRYLISFLMRKKIWFQMSQLNKNIFSNVSRPAVLNLWITTSPVLVISTFQMVVSYVNDPTAVIFP